MFATRRMPVEIELVKWMVLLAIALALLATLATAVAWGEPLKTPALLPRDIAELAQPMDVTPPFFPENPPTTEIAPPELAAKLWLILQHQRAGCYGDALAGWGQVQLPERTAVWENIAAAAAYLAVGDQLQATVELDLARRLAPNHPVVAYYTGLLRLEQAAAAARAPDGYDEGNLRLVNFVPRQGQEARQLYEALARAELRQAIAGAAVVRIEERLLGHEGATVQQVVGPRVGDLLVALGADNFAGKAHNLLFRLELDRGELAIAEQHLDAAVATGIAPLYGYADLAEAYDQQQDNAHVLRVARKDLQANYPAMWQTCRELQAAWQRTLEGWVW